MDLDTRREINRLKQENADLRSRLAYFMRANSRQNIASQGNPIRRRFERSPNGSVFEVTIADDGTTASTKVR